MKSCCLCTVSGAYRPRVDVASRLTTQAPQQLRGKTLLCDSQTNPPLAKTKQAPWLATRPCRYHQRGTLTTTSPRSRRCQRCEPGQQRFLRGPPGQLFSYSVGSRVVYVYSRVVILQSAAHYRAGAFRTFGLQGVTRFCLAWVRLSKSLCLLVRGKRI